MLLLLTKLSVGDTMPPFGGFFAKLISNANKKRSRLGQNTVTVSSSVSSWTALVFFHQWYVDQHDDDDDDGCRAFGPTGACIRTDGLIWKKKGKRRYCCRISIGGACKKRSKRAFAWVVVYYFNAVFYCLSGSFFRPRKGIAVKRDTSRITECTQHALQWMMLLPFEMSLVWLAVQPRLLV